MQHDQPANGRPPIALVAGFLILLVWDVVLTSQTSSSVFPIKALLIFIGMVATLYRLKLAATILALWLTIAGGALLYSQFPRGDYILLALSIFYIAFAWYLRYSKAQNRFLSTTSTKNSSESNHV
jgi:predicted membrane-bound mannosyltransferase